METRENWRQDDPLAGPRAALEADLAVHQALRDALVLFYGLIARAASPSEPHVLAELRSQPVYHVAEFFYLLRAYDLRTPEQLRTYVDLHNEQIRALAQDRDRMRLYGFTPSRLKKALIDEASTTKMIVNHQHFEGGFDQSDLARLLVELMAPETCRQTIVTLSEVGLLHRAIGVYNSILVRSTGALEYAFACHIRALREGFASHLPPLVG